MDKNAIMAVLDALINKGHADMSDSLSEPEDKLTDAVAMASDKGSDGDTDIDTEDMDDDDDTGMPDVSPLADGAEMEDEEEDPSDMQSMLKRFMNPKPKGIEPGTAYRIVVDADAPMSKKFKR
jgi:hypothetical protein